MATEVSNFIRDLQEMVLHQFHKYIDWDLTRKEQGAWPTKPFVNMWFNNETNVATMIGLLEILKRTQDHTLHGQVVSTRLEMSPIRKPIGKGPCFVLRRPEYQTLFTAS